MGLYCMCALETSETIIPPDVSNNSMTCYFRKIDSLVFLSTNMKFSVLPELDNFMTNQSVNMVACPISFLTPCWQMKLINYIRIGKKSYPNYEAPLVPNRPLYYALCPSCLMGESSHCNFAPRASWTNLRIVTSPFASSPTIPCCSNFALLTFVG